MEEKGVHTADDDLKSDHDSNPIFNWFFGRFHFTVFLQSGVFSFWFLGFFSRSAYYASGRHGYTGITSRD